MPLCPDRDPLLCLACIWASWRRIWFCMGSTGDPISANSASVLPELRTIVAALAVVAVSRKPRSSCLLRSVCGQTQQDREPPHHPTRIGFLRSVGRRRENDMSMTNRLPQPPTPQRTNPAGTGVETPPAESRRRRSLHGEEAGALVREILTRRRRDPSCLAHGS